jgi:CO/xanthine dehydrogenase FAD-binding subunit
MYSAPFDYLKATSWREAVDLLGRYGESAKVLAGGQSLVPMMSLRLATPSHVIDVNEADDGAIRQANGTVEISALVRHAELERSPVLARSCPMIAEAAGLIGNIRVRHRGTIGGSLAHADPSAELPCALLALGGTIRVLGAEGERRIPADSFFLSYFTTALDPSEVVVTVEVPAARERSGTAFIELAQRAGDFATVEVASVIDLDPSEACRQVRLAVGGIADSPVDLSDAARVLVGERMDDGLIADAARAVSGSSDPRGDDRASSEYRRELVRVLSRRALVRAWQRARGDGG